LSAKDTEKYVGDYFNEDLSKTLSLYIQNGVFYLQDEFSGFSGPSLLLYKGDDKFDLLDCNSCQLTFEIDRDEIRYVKRDYGETVTFKPKERE